MTKQPTHPARLAPGAGVRRRSLLAGASGGGFALLSGTRRSRAAGIEQPTIDISGVRDPQLGAQLAIADQWGFFKEQGLNATVRWNQSGADIITLLAGGSQYIGGGGIFGQVIFSAQDLPVRIIAALADIAGTQGFALSPGVKLSSPKELEGKKLAYTQGNSQVLILAKLAQQHGVDVGKITLVNMNPSEGVVAASKGDVHGLLGWQPFLYRLVEMGGSMYVTATTSYLSGKPERLPFDGQLQYNNSCLQANTDWIKNKPNTLKAVLAAFRKATDVLNNERDKALDTLETVLRVDKAALKVMVEANRYGMAIDDKLATAVSFTSDWAMSIKRVPQAVTPAQAFAPQLLAEVDPALVTWKAS